MKKAIPKQVTEGFELLNVFYGFAKEDDPDQYILKEEFRQDAYRIIVLQFQLAIEELLKASVHYALSRLSTRRTFTAKQNVEYVQKMRSREALDLAARLGILTKLGHTELARLNTIRNQCSHNWGLHSFKVVKTGKNAPRKRLYKVDFKGKNLLHPRVMKEEFMPLYSGVYLDLFAAYYSIDEYPRKYTERNFTGPPSKKL